MARPVTHLLMLRTLVPRLDLCPLTRLYVSPVARGIHLATHVDGPGRPDCNSDTGVCLLGPARMTPGRHARVQGVWPMTGPIRYLKSNRSVCVQVTRELLGEVGTASLPHGLGWGWKAAGPLPGGTTLQSRGHSCRLKGLARSGARVCKTLWPVVARVGGTLRQCLQGCRGPAVHPRSGPAGLLSSGRHAQGLGISLTIGVLQAAGWASARGRGWLSGQWAKGPLLGHLPCPRVPVTGQLAWPGGCRQELRSPGAPAPRLALAGSACTRPLHVRLANQDVPPGLRSRPLLLATRGTQLRTQPETHAGTHPGTHLAATLG